MAKIIFYEKPGCINNTRQKQMLLNAGHELETRDLLKEPWTKDSLQVFFNKMPVADWLNPSAPAVKLGAIEPASLSEDQAIAMMIGDPILIRRPLLQVADEYLVGFDQNKIDGWIGLAAVDDQLDVETCPQMSGHSCKSN